MRLGRENGGERCRGRNGFTHCFFNTSIIGILYLYSCLFTILYYIVNGLRNLQSGENMYSLKSKLVVIFFSLFLISPVFSQSSTDLNLEYAGSGLWSNLKDIVIKNHYAYCAAPYGLVIFDIGDKSNPVIERQVYLNESVYCLELKGNLLFAGFYDTGLKIFDISRPLNPRLVGDLYTEYKVSDIVVRGHNAYLATAYGLLIIDISDLRNLEIIGQFDTEYGYGYSAQNVTVKDDIAYLAAGDLWIINIADPRHPTEICRYSDNWHFYINDVKIRDSLLYVADGSNIVPHLKSALTILNVKNPETPEVVGSYEFLGNLNKLEIRGDYAYLCADVSGMAIFDISDPADPFPVGCFPPLGEAVDMALCGHHVYLLNVHGGLTEDQHCADICGDYDSTYETNSENVVSASDFLVIDVADMTDPVLVGRHVAPVGVYRFIFDGDYAFIANTEWNENYGATIADISKVDNFDVLSNIVTPYDVSSVALSGQTLFLADITCMTIVDISDVASPRIIGDFNIDGFSCGNLQVEKEVMYLSYSNNSGVHVMDVSDPENINELTVIKEGDNIGDILVHNDILYTTTSSAPLLIYDVSSPKNPVLLADYYHDSTVSLGRFYLQDSLLFFYGSVGVGVINVADPINPFYVSKYPASTYSDFCVVDNIAYLPQGRGGFEVVDFRDIYNPRHLGEYNTNGYTISTGTDGKGCVYIGDLSGLLRFRPSVMTSVEDDISEQLVPESMKLRQNYPNPFNPTTNIEFTLEKKTGINLSVFNILGQKVRTLVDRELSAGDHHIEWNAEDDTGRKVASGIYFYRLSFDDISVSKKMILLK